MTDVRVATVDVFPLRRSGVHWQVLALQRAPSTRCTGAWEVVHGHIEPGETPEDAAERELREETGLALERLYNVTVQPFYLHTARLVTLAVVFAAVVDPDATVTLGEEHARADWLDPADAIARFAWPRSRAILGDVLWLLRDGDAGAVEDVLRVR